MLFVLFTYPILSIPNFALEKIHYVYTIFEIIIYNISTTWHAYHRS